MAEEWTAYGIFGAQADFVDCDRPFVAFVGGRGSGKTRGGAIKLLALLSKQKTFAVVTAPTFPMLRDATMKTCLELWPRSLITDQSKTEMRIALANGSEVLFRSTDDPDHLRGPNVGVVWMDEAAQSPLEAWQILLGTLRLAPGRAFVTSTPVGFNWVYQEFMAKKRPDYTLFMGSSRANWHLPPDFIKRLEDSYQADFALQEIEGQFVMVGGSSYFDTGRLKEMLEASKTGGEFRPYIVGRRYAAGLDPAGEGADRHSLGLLDCQTGEFVVDMTGNEAVGEFALKTYRMLGGYEFPLLGVEKNGVGLAMLEALKGLGYPAHRLIYQDEKKTKPGIVMSADFRERILVDLAEGVRQGSLVVYSRAAIDEMFSFLRAVKGRPAAVGGAHDDRVMAMALASWVSRQVPASQGEGDAGVQDVRPSHRRKLQGGQAKVQSFR